MRESKIININGSYILEAYTTPISYNMNSTHIHVIDTSNGVMVLNSDDSLSTTGNIRNNSFIFDGTTQNTLLNTNPYSYTDISIANNFLDSRFPSNSVLYDYNQDYKVYRLHIKNGVSLASDIIGIALTMKIEYDGRIIDLANIFDNKSISNFVVNRENIYYNNEIYSNYLEFKILNINDIIQNQNSEAQELMVKLLGLTNANEFNRANLSNITIEFNLVSLSDYSSENELAADNNTYQFNKFERNSVVTTYDNITETSSILSNDIKMVNSGNTYAINLKLQHPSLSLDQAFAELSNNIEHVDVEHIVYMNEFDGVNSIGVTTNSFKNLNVVYEDYSFIPILQDNTTTANFTLLSIIRVIGGTEIARQATLSLSDAQLDLLRQHNTSVTLNVESTEIVNRIEQNQIIMDSGVNNVNGVNVSLSNYTHYTRLISIKVDENIQQVDEIEIPLSNTPRLVEFTFIGTNDMVLSTQNLGDLTIRIGNSIISEFKRDNNSVIFRLSNPKNQTIGEIVNNYGDLVAQFGIK